MKATSIFGGVQVFNILIQIIRSKFVALLLGPSGMGFFGLLATTINLVSSVTNLGLSNSAVRNIAAANNGDDNDAKISYTVSIFRKLVWFTGLFGLLVVLVFSPILSSLTFNNTKYTYAFAILSVTLLVNQLAAGQRVLLQGMRQIKLLAQTNIIGSVGSLLVTLPLYYLYGIDGVVPAMVITAIVTLIIQFFFSRKIVVKKVSMSIREAIVKGSDMIKMGVILSLSGLISAVASYIVRVFISHNGSMADVGLYNAGFNIISSYVGLVFSAMTTDYYPRLAAVSKNKDECNILINNQFEVAIYILSPLLCIFIVFISWIVVFLYSSKFLPISEMVHWAIMGIFFKAMSWSIGVLIMARGDSKYFFWNELIANIYLLTLNILGYHFFGLEGLGISFLVGYIIHALQIYFFARIKYNFKLDNSIFFLFSFNIFLAAICFLVNKTLEPLYNYLIGGICILVAAFYSVYSLNKKTDVINTILCKLKKK